MLLLWPVFSDEMLVCVSKGHICRKVLGFVRLLLPGWWFLGIHGRCVLGAGAMPQCWWLIEQCDYLLVVLSVFLVEIACWHPSLVQISRSKIGLKPAAPRRETDRGDTRKVGTQFSDQNAPKPL